MSSRTASIVFAITGCLPTAIGRKTARYVKNSSRGRPPRLVATARITTTAALPTTIRRRVRVAAAGCGSSNPLRRHCLAPTTFGHSTAHDLSRLDPTEDIYRRRVYAGNGTACLRYHIGL